MLTINIIKITNEVFIRILLTRNKKKVSTHVIFSKTTSKYA